MDEKNHELKELTDKIRMVSELEHIRYHAIKSYIATTESEGDDFIGQNITYYAIAHKAKELRRELMKEFFPNLTPEQWCLAKATASLEQSLFEIAESIPSELFGKTEQLIADFWQMVTGQDITECVACKEDKVEEVEEGSENV